MTVPIHFLSVLFLAGFALLGGVIAYQLMTRRIVADGLLRSDCGATTDPERVLLIFITVWGCVYLAASSLAAPVPADAGAVPAIFELPDWLVAIVGGGNLSYLTGKGLRAQAHSADSP